MKLRKCINMEEQPSGFDQFLQNLWYFVQMESQRHTSKPFCLSFIIFHLPELDGCAWGRLGVQWFV